MKIAIAITLALFHLAPGIALPADHLTHLFSRPWQFSAGEHPAGAMYIFLPNGTLLETSCVETYRIATWAADKSNPKILRITEDGRLAFTATITSLSDTRLELQQTLAHGGEKHTLTLKAVNSEFVCPDLNR